MKKSIAMLTVFFAIIHISCSGDDDSGNSPTFPNENVEVTTQMMQSAQNFPYKVHFQQTDVDSTRKGIVILTHGDGGNADDGILNEQCRILAQQGYIGVTSSYRNPTGTPEEINQRYLADIESVIAGTIAEFGIPRSKVVIGGLSRGGNLTYSLILPGQPGVAPIAGIRAAILECAGGDQWKGSAVLYPVAFASNQSDDVLGMNDANEFLNGLAANANMGVTAQSGSLIINGTDHCGNAGQYKTLVVQKVMEWLP